MIKVVIRRNKDKTINNIKVSGHADSAEYGKDLVCAAVSLATVGSANALEKYGFFENAMGTADIKEGNFQIKVVDSNDKIQVVLETLETLLETVEYSYSKYIKITKMEE